MGVAKCLFYLLCTCCFLQIKGMGMDYYFGFDDSALRSQPTWVSKQGQLVCKKLCGNRMALCSSEGSCYCLQTQVQTPEAELIVAVKAKHGKRRGSDDERFGDDYLGISLELPNYRTRKDNKNSDQSESGELFLQSAELRKPALRHHIAHFCPNLTVARACIKTCMKLGKPAFCGKDHVCYCGHRYSSHDVDVEKDPKKTYGQFNDIYAKYFGPNKESQEDADNPTDNEESEENEK